MAPVHARPIRTTDGKLELGKDAVVFLGGAPDPYVAGALATSPDAAYYLLPIARDASTFGMAIITLDDPPRDDEPVSWSMYPFGLDPAPIAATRGTSPIRVARVYPRAAGLRAPRAIELGRVDPGGAFASFGVVAEDPAVARVSIATDSAGGVLLAYEARSAAAVLRLRCP
jgi:hypothetical protein